VGTVVVDDHDADVKRRRLALDACDRLAQEFHRVACRDDHADRRRTGDRPADVIRAFPGAFDDRAVLARPSEPVLEAAASRKERFRLRQRAACDRALVHAPVVEDLTHMSDLRGHLSATKEEVIVLAAVEGCAEAAGAFEELATHHGEVAHVIATVHQFRRPVRLEMREDTPAPGVEPVLVRIDEVARWVCAEVVDHLEERVRTENIVVVEERDELTGGHVGRRLRRLCNPAVDKALAKPDARIVTVAGDCPAGRSGSDTFPAWNS